MLCCTEKNHNLSDLSSIPSYVLI